MAKVPMTYPYDESYPDVDLYQKLDKIRDRPVMWIGSKTISALSAYIAGLSTLSHVSLGHGPKCFNLISEPPFEEFHDFIRVRYDLGDEFVSWWAGLLRVEQELNGSEGAEERGVDRFFADLDAFRAQGE